MLFVMPWPYLTMIFIYDKLRSYSEFCVQCSKKDHKCLCWSLFKISTQNSSEHKAILSYPMSMIVMVCVNLWVW